MAKTELETFPALVPSKVLTATVGNVTVTSKLYGDVSPERLAREEKDVKYRAEQLSPLPARKRQEREQDPFERTVDAYESFNNNVVRGGGRR